MTTKLILVEGLPGSGKTTTALKISKILTKQGVPNILFVEGDLDHPADFEGVACLSKKEYEDLLESHKHEKNIIESMTVNRDDDFYLYYAKQLSEDVNISDNLLDDIEKHDVYKLPIDRFSDILLGQWERFGRKAEADDQVYIFECSFLQNPLCTYLARDDRSYLEIKKFILSLYERIEHLEPLLIYCDQQDVSGSFLKVKEERSQGWYDFSVWYYTQQQFGKNRMLQGIDGVLRFLHERKEIEHHLLAELGIYKLFLNNHSRESSKEEIEQYFKHVFK
ncbi:hypothetical protein [Fictibacillus sp. BK138]|uniref:hypothetical protein n=1 Tax=Fictibacillus sp. BK138 TaxID=2512121 RepID=UPI001028BA1A|nr:hypothetical protein [Fictibacillus sp. BK138]RZT15503.1 hypothetical protein EV282_3706 [Fictibacillus sp. BK138]